MESLGTSLSNSPKIMKSAIFFFKNMLVFFDYRPLLTRKWKLVEVLMTVAMYQPQQHSRRGQIIDTRKPESGIVLT